MEDYRDTIIRLIGMKGPVLPSHINRDLKRDLIFTGAMLSELVDSKKLKLTRLKVGGSPLYYLPGQEHRLQYFTKNLHEKEQKAYELLRQNLVLADREQEPVIRAALREIKDFAVPLEVTANGVTTLFWKWSLLPQAEAETLIKEKVSQPHVEPPLAQPSQPSHILSSPPPSTTLPPTLSVVDAIQKHKEMLMQQTSTIQQLPPAPTSVPESLLTVAPVTPPTPLPLKELVEKKQKKKPAKEKSLVSEHELQKKLSEEIETPPVVEPTDDDFYAAVKKYFNKNNIVIKKLSIQRKNSELEAEISVPSSIGTLDFYCKAKNKMRCSDGDISTVFLEGQRRKLPILFLTTGEITKKAITLLSSELKTVTVKKL